MNSQPGAPASQLERRLLDVLRGPCDRSVASEDLAAIMRDQPGEQYVSPYRTTILDCFEFRAGGAQVLEVGADCGAVTRWLGENCGTVHALERDPDRADVARARCADLSNVSIDTAGHWELDLREAFDVVTLIGAFDRSDRGSPQANEPVGAAQAVLAFARGALREDGVLVVATDNRLGLAYLNGARQGPDAKPFESVQGYPLTTAPTTFSAHRLRQMLSAAGFSQASFYLPYPSYRCAHTIVNAEHADPCSSAYDWLACTPPDPRIDDRGALYNGALAERELTRAGLLVELANSFVILAYVGNSEQSDKRLGIERHWRARRYMLDRRPGLQKRVTIEPPPRDLLRNESALGRDHRAVVGVLSHKLEDEVLPHGRALVFDAHAAIADTGSGEHFARLIAAHRDWLVDQHASGWIDEDGMPLIAGECFDATWWNIAVTDDGTWQLIDHEWRFQTRLPVDYVVWRTLSQYARIFRSYLPHRWRAIDHEAFADHWLNQAQPGLTAARRAYLRRIENVASGSMRFTGAAPPSATPMRRELVSLSASMAELTADRQLLISYLTMFAPADDVLLSLWVDSSRAELDVAGLRAAIEDVGLPEDRQPDVLVTVSPDPEARRRAVTAAAAILTREPRGAKPQRPCVSTGDALRRLVERRWVERDAAPGPGRRTMQSALAGRNVAKLGVLLTYNDDDIAGEVIDHLLANDHEVIVWDNGSEDGTWDALSARAGDLLELRRVPRAECGLYEIYGAMSRHLIRDYVDCYDWISWPDSDEILLGSDLSISYADFVGEVAASPFDWVQFLNWNFWWTDEDDESTSSPLARIRHYALFPDCAPRIRAWRASKTNVRAFNHNPVAGPRWPTLANLCHYPMRGPEQASKKLRTRAGIQRGDANWHYNKMQRDPSILRIDGAELCALANDPRIPGGWNLCDKPFGWRTVYDR